MIEGLLGKKEGMTQIFSESGEMLPVTVVRVGPCEVVQVKDEKKDGYNALQLGFEGARERRVKKPQLGHFKKSGISPKKFLKEVRFTGETPFKVGDTLTVGLFKDVPSVDVVGVSKGKGFSGTIKRWNFQAGPKSHGSMNIRAPGSIGSSAFPSRVFKGKKMPGRMGGKRTTVRNLKVIKVDEEKNLLLVKGAVPGPNEGLLLVRVSKAAPIAKKGTEKKGKEK